MPRDWKEISEDELLNFQEAHTGQMARYDRIMQKFTRDSLNDVQKELATLGERVGKSTDRLVNVGNRLIKTIDQQSEAQNKHQRAVVALTVVIAISTVAYTAITWLSVEAAQEANRIQAASLSEAAPTGEE